MVAAASPPTSRLAGLDGLRAVAALAVFVHHVGAWSGATVPGFWGNLLGRLDIGVPVFFALSGFLLFRPIVRSVLDGPALTPAGEFLWRRVLRLYPAYWVALALIIAFTTEGFEDVTGAVVNVLLVQIHWPTHSLGPIPQAWSLATEMSFYLALPVLARVMRPLLAGRDRGAQLGGLFLLTVLLYGLSVTFRIIVLGIDGRWTSSMVLWLAANFDYFAIGMALAIAHVGFAPASSARRRLDRWAAPAGLWWLGALGAFLVVSQLMGLGLVLETASWPREMGRQFMYGVIGFALLFPLVFGSEQRSVVRSFVRSGPMEWMGLISYSFSLWHMAFIIHTVVPLDELVESLWDGPRFFSLLVVAGIPTLVVAWLSYLIVERAGMRAQNAVRLPRVDPTRVEAWIGARVAWWQRASYRAQMAVVVGVAAVVRGSYLVFAKLGESIDGTANVFPGDQFYYSHAADALADGDGFVVPYDEFTSPLSGQPAADHPPLTALVAAPASWLAGGADGTNAFAHRVVMSLGGLAVVPVIGYLGREVAGRTVGVVAALLAAVYPGFWVNDGLVMAESLTTLFIAAALWAAVRYRHHPSLRGAVVFGACIGMAGLARSESLLLGALIGVPLVWVTHRSLAQRAVRLGAAGAVAALVVAPWVVPNMMRFEEPVTMSTNDGLTLAGSYNDDVYSGPFIGFWTYNAPALVELDLTGLDQSEVSRVYRDLAVEYVRDNVRETPAVVAARLGRLWSVYQPRQMSELNTGEGREIWVSNLAFTSFYAIAGLAAVGAWYGRRTRSVPTWILLMPVLHVSLMGAAFYGIPRFRVPAEVGLVVLAALGTVRLVSLAACRLKRTSSSRRSSSSPASSSTALSASRS